VLPASLLSRGFSRKNKRRRSIKGIAQLGPRSVVRGLWAAQVGESPKEGNLLWRSSLILAVWFFR
jgi:hypothetical protein